MPNPTDLIAQLQRVEHFRHLPEADLRTIVASGRVRRFTTGEVICNEGEPCAGMFVLLRGRIHLRKVGPGGQESILAVIEPIIMFNEVPALDGGPNLATAVAVTESLAWQIGCENFQALLGRYPQIGLGLLKVLARRNRALVSQYEDLSFRSVQARAAKLLLDLSDSGQRPIDRRTYPNQQMAARIATVPEAFSRTLNTFRRHGFISATRVEITLHDPDALAHLAMQSPRAQLSSQV
jgi:CRP/FNR family transcriptional regulator